jgi:hypothetical protein
LFGTLAGLEEGDDWRMCVRALGDGRVTPNSAVNARADDSRPEDQESLSFAGFEALLTRRCLGCRHWPHLAASHPPTQLKMWSLSIGPVVASPTIVELLKIQRGMDPTLVFTISGRLDVENVGELCHLIDAEPAGAVMVLELTDLVLADRDAVRYLRDYETGGRIVLRNCPAYIRAWMAAEENH